MRMQGRQRHHKKPKAKKRVRPLKRLLHLPGGEVWSWQMVRRYKWGDFTLGVRIRSPEGKTWWADASNFIFGWDDWQEPHDDCYCCEECFRYSGYGFAPSFIKRYVEVVCKGGREWNIVTQTKAHNGWGW